MKRCSRCKIEKDYVEFSPSKKSKDGYASACKKCHAEENRTYRKNNRSYLASGKKWRDTHKLEHKAMSKCCREKNPEKSRISSRKWRSNNYQKALEVGRKSNKKRRSTIKGKLNSNMSCHVWYSLHGVKGYRKWKKLTGYTIEQLKTHIEKQFKNGMSWSNYGSWHIDHKIPVSAFNFQTAEDIDFKKCWDLKNLQPLWAKDNIIKSNKLEKPFQPSLNISLCEQEGV